MKTQVVMQEWYPVYELRSDGVRGDYEVEISEELKARYDAALSEFSLVQNEIRTACKAYD